MALVPRSPARSVGHCRLTDEELSGRGVRRPREAPWDDHGESVCVCLCVDMGSGWGNQVGPGHKSFRFFS